MALDFLTFFSARLAVDLFQSVQGIVVSDMGFPALLGGIEKSHHLFKRTTRFANMNSPKKVLFIVR